VSNVGLESQKRPRRQLTPEQLKKLQEEANRVRQEQGLPPIKDDYVPPKKRNKPKGSQTLASIVDATVTPIEEVVPPQELQARMRVPRSNHAPGNG
jgi:hypothetical protein